MISPQDKALLYLLAISFAGAVSCKGVDAWREHDRRECVQRCMSKAPTAACKEACP